MDKTLYKTYLYMWVISWFEAVYSERNALLAGASVPVGDHTYMYIVLYIHN